MEKRSKKVLIVEKAVALFKEKGVNNVTILEICNELGIPRSSFYYHFKTKEDVIDSFFLSSELEITDHLIPLLASKNSYDQFVKIYSVLLDRTVDWGPEIYSLMIRRFMEGKNNVFSPENITMYEVYISLINQAQENAEMKNMSPAEEIIEMLIYLSLGIAVDWCSKNGSFDFKKAQLKLIEKIFQPTI